MTVVNSVLQDDISEVIEGINSFLSSEVKARHEKYGALLDDPMRVFGANGRYCDEVLNLMREVRLSSASAGYYTMFVPEELGGAGLGYEASYRVWEAIFSTCGSRLWLGHSAVGHWTRGPSPLLRHLPQAVIDEYLPPLMSGRATSCFALSEPDAGTDVWQMRTRAVLEDTEWRINGEKQWISNGAHADCAVVFAVTDSDAVHNRSGGVTAFILPTSTNGFAATSVIAMFGHAGSNEAILRLDDVRVPETHVVGVPGEGLTLALEGIAFGRLYNAAKAVGLARWAIEQAATYAGERKVFGRPLAEHQGVSFPLADSVTELHAARLMGLNCARLLDQGQPARKELAMAKLFSTEAALRAIDRAMQTHGAMGFTNELGLSEAWQMIRVVCVADGSSELLRRQISQQYLRGDRNI